MGEIRFDYVQEFCKPSHYLCLMPIAYEKGEDGHYHKREMVCNLVKMQKCNLQRECLHFVNAAEIHQMPELLMEKI